MGQRASGEVRAEAWPPRPHRVLEVCDSHSLQRGDPTDGDEQD
jgi:hypothetical protein